MMVLYVHRNHKAYTGRGKGWVGGGGGRIEMNSSSKRSDSQRQETVSHRQSNNVKRMWGPRQCEATLCTSLIAVSAAVRSKVTESEKQLLKPEAKVQLSVSMRADLHLPPLDLARALKHVSKHGA